MSFEEEVRNRMEENKRHHGIMSLKAYTAIINAEEWIKECKHYCYRMAVEPSTMVDLDNLQDHIKRVKEVINIHRGN